MSAPVTEAHRELAYAILFATEYGPAGPNETAQLIADSEAKACDQLRAEVAWWKNWHDENEKMEDGIAVKVQATIDGLRAEVERLTAELEQESKWKAREYLARAERAEAEVDQLTDGLRDSEAALALNALRAERAEAELDGIRALANRRNKRYHVEDTTHQLVVALDQALDIAQAELAAEQDNSAINEIKLRASRAIVSKIWVQLGSLTYEQLKGRSIYDLIDELKAELAKERARLDWLMAGGVCMVQHTGGFRVSRLHAPVSRAAIDAAMKEETK